MTHATPPAPPILAAKFGPFEGYVDADAALAFALATNDPNLVYQEGGAVPLLYTVALILPSLSLALKASARESGIPEAHGSVHGEHDVYFHAPVQPGTTVRWDVWPHAIHQTPAGALLTQRILVTDDAGSSLVEHFWSNLFVGFHTDMVAGPPLADHRYPEAARSHILGVEAFDLTPDQAYRYAGVSYDHAPHAVDEEVARQEGYPSKILQGMCSLAMCSGAVVKLAAGGDPSRVRRLAARFAAPVFPKRMLPVELAAIGSTPEGHQAVAFEATSAGVPCIRHGRADISAPKEPGGQ
jgi:acyl dehydratase